MDKKVIGIIGGTGPLATADLFQKIVLHTRAATDREHLHVLIDSNTAIPDRTAAILSGGEDPTAELIKSMGFTYIRLAPELYMRQETANLIRRLQTEGFTILGSGADSHEILSWLTACGVAYSSGTITGVPVDEDEMIRDCLNRER